MNDIVIRCSFLNITFTNEFNFKNVPIILFNTVVSNVKQLHSSNYFTYTVMLI